jgi:hypothetical protein
MRYVTTDALVNIQQCHSGHVESEVRDETRDCYTSLRTKRTNK